MHKKIRNKLVSIFCKLKRNLKKRIIISLCKSNKVKIRRENKKMNA